MNRKAVWEAIGAVAFVISIGISVLMLFSPAAQEWLLGYIGNDNYFLATIISIILTVTSIVAAPTSTSFVVVAMLTIADWRAVLAGAIIGDVIGFTIAFQISRTYREKVFEFLPWLEKFSHWEEHISNNSKLIHFTFLRMVTLYVGDYLSYIAGLSNINFRDFFLASLFANVVYKGIAYSAIGLSADQNQLWMVFIVFTAVSLIAWGLFVLYERRHAQAAPVARPDTRNNL